MPQQTIIPIPLELAQVIFSSMTQIQLSTLTLGQQMDLSIALQEFNKILRDASKKAVTEKEPVTQ